MKKLLEIVVLGLLLSGCLQDKSEKAIKNCADTEWSKNIVVTFEEEFMIGGVYLWGQKPENILDEKVLILKQAGFQFEEIWEWSKGLKTAKIDDTNKEIINYFIKLKNETNKSQDDYLKLPLEDKLQDPNYEKMFVKCEQIRKKAIKTFDAKWKKPILVKAKFR
ncbi:MAG: hypothetical protein HOH00_04675 [Candidatus Pelagibacter sp.]|jgi:hypothetical protein|nr:hypothetical protein [Candidatus Pelagibacter sp.]